MIIIFIKKLIFKLKYKSCKVGSGVLVSRKVIVGKDCLLGRNSSISPNVILGNNVSVGEGVSLRNINIGNSTMIESGVKTPGTQKGKIKIGKECYIGINNVFDTSDDINIGDYVHIAGPSTGLWCHSSAKMCLNSIPLKDKERDKFRPTAPINIESNVYIGGNCTIYPGVTIGHHSIVTPNSVVTKSFLPYSFIGGVPAVKIKNIKNKSNFL